MLTCFICSAARSGSTLLDMLIGGHPHAVSLGEFSFLGKALALDQDCGCGAKLARCSAWSVILDRVKTERGIDLRETPYAMPQWDTRAATLVDHRQQTKLYLAGAKLRSLLCDLRFTLAAGHPLRPPLSTRLEQGRDNTSYLFETIAETWDKKVLVDSSKNIHKALAMHEHRPQRTRIVFLTRDGRGVFHSRRSSGFSPERSVGAWRRYNERALRLLRRRIAPQDLLQLKYEDLVANVPRELDRLCAFLEIDFYPAMLDLAAGERHVFNGNDTRFARDQGIRRDERWKSALQAGELAYFMRHAGALNTRLGYA